MRSLSRQSCCFIRQSSWLTFNKSSTSTQTLAMNKNIGRLLIEYKRSWKLFTLMVGLILLIIGSTYYQAPDWDIPISFIMAFFTYLTASWSMHVVVERRWKMFPLMLFYTWFSIDGCYWLYWNFKNPQALELMRDVNFLASLTLYSMCGLIWYYQASINPLIKHIIKIKFD